MSNEFDGTIDHGVEPVDSQNTVNRIEPAAEQDNEFQSIKFEPMAEPAVQTVTESVSEPTVQTDAEPVSEPTIQAVTEPVSESTVQTDAEQVSEPTIQAVTESVSESAVRADAEPVLNTAPRQESEGASSSYHFWEQQKSAGNGPQPTENQDLNQGMDQNIHVEYSQNEAFSGTENQPPHHKKNSFFIKAIKLIGAAAVFGIVAGGCFQGVGYLYHKLNPQEIQTGSGFKEDVLTETAKKADKIAVTPVLNNVSSDGDVSAIVEAAMPSIVSITSTISQKYRDLLGNIYDDESSGSGSGIIIGKNSSELLIVTNNHVVADAKEIKVTFINNDIMNATVKGKDSSADIAVVAVNLSDIKDDTISAIKVATLGDSDKVKVGERVLAIGNALGYGQSLTVGYISAKNREVNVENNKMTLLQTDAAINPGNSGGALINMRGEVIGINSVKYAAATVEGMGYSIPITSATPIFNELMKKVTVKSGEEGYLGIAGRDVTDDVSEMYNMPVGAFVSEAVKGNAAEKAGILSGDIITGVNGIETKTMTALKELVNSYPAGTVVTVTLQRREGSEYQKKDIKVTLQKQPETTTNKSENGTDSDSGSGRNPFSIPEEDSNDSNRIQIPFGFEYTPQN